MRRFTLAEMAARFPALPLPDCLYSGSLAEHPAFDMPVMGCTAVVACHFNPCGFVRPVENLRRFLNWSAMLGIPLFMAELTFAGGVAPVLPQDHPRVLQVVTGAENLLFQKEALLNAVVARLPEFVRNVVWLDADVLLTNGEFLWEVEAALTRRPVVQPFARCIWTDADGSEAALRPSFGAGIACGDARCVEWRRYHPGFGGAARRALFSEFGGLWPYGISGSGDAVFALAAAGKFRRGHYYLEPYSEAAFAHAARWAAAVSRWAGGVGVVGGDVVHLWHGSPRGRNYRGKLALLGSYDPERHLSIARGALEWTPAAFAEIPETVRGLAESFPARREDAA